MSHDASAMHESRGSSSEHRHRPRTSLRVRNVAEGVVYHLVFEGDVRRLSGQQLRHHLARISHIPSAEQLLTVRGAAFSAKALGGDVGLHQDDTVDLLRSEMNGAADHRGPSAATASSLRPSTDAGTMSPEAPPSRPHGAKDVGGDAQPMRSNTFDGHPRQAQPWASSSSTHRPGRGGGGGGMRTSAARSSMGSTATSNTRVAPSPERLVERTEQHLPPPPPPSLQARSSQRPLHPDSTYEASQLPMSTSATSLSSIQLARREDEGESPRPHMPYPASSAYVNAGPAAPSSSLQQQQQQQQQQHRRHRASVERSPTDTPGRHYHRPSYEVPSPYERPPPQQRRSQQQQQQQQQQYLSDDYATQQYGMPGDLSSSYMARQQKNGLNQSYMDPVHGGSRSLGHPTYSSYASPLPPRTQAGSSYHYRSDPAPPSASLVPAAPAHYVPIRAGDLETLLDEQDYIWRMEEYRFRTERLNRLHALQNRQRELAFEAARYDQAVAVVSTQLSRERRKLLELQEAMSHHTASLGSREQRHGTKFARPSAMDEEPRGEDEMSEVIEVDV